MKMKTLFLLLIIGQSALNAQFVFLPPGLHFAPLRANVKEPRIGVFKFLDAGEMKVDIGNSVDLFGYEIPSAAVRLTAGIDFTAYAYTTGAQGLRLQIDAVDGLFGGNVSFSKSDDGAILQARLRILHHSAHLVDGHYSVSGQRWLDNRGPFPYTQDFGDLTIARVVHPSSGILRYYGGFSYATLVRPEEIGRVAFLGGSEIAFPIGAFGDQPANLYVAYNVNLDGTPEYSASHQLQGGIKFGNWFAKGPSLYLAYYAGRHFQGEYYTERLTTVGAGFTVDF